MQSSVLYPQRQTHIHKVKYESEEVKRDELGEETSDWAVTGRGNLQMGELAQGFTGTLRLIEVFRWNGHFRGHLGLPLTLHRRTHTTTKSLYHTA